MLFNSLSFLLFFVCVAALYPFVPSWRARKGMLVAVSYLFYAAWYPPHILILVVATAVDWLVANAIANAGTQRKKRALLVISLVSNLGMLGLFKYAGFAVANANVLLRPLGVQLAAPSLVLPVGISFFTFEALSYTIDVYRGTMKPSRSLLDFALFIAFFPRMVAGPIMRAELFLPQCERPRAVDADRFASGVLMLVFGLAGKVAIADGILAPIADRVFAQPGAYGPFDTGLGTLAFAGQIFFDFAGYSTCAIGLGRCFGFELPANFKSPYAAIGLSDFWRRWHISLSSWLRDYLYISLGGNRHGRWRTRVNLVVTMLLGGLWHGAAWTFVIWGALHGLYLIIERGVRALPWPSSVRDSAMARTGAWAATFAAVCLAWVFFRAPDFSSAWTLVGVMVGHGPAAVARLGAYAEAQVLAITAAMVAAHVALRERTSEELFAALRLRVQAPLVAAALALLAVSPGDNRAFIYFKF